MNIQNVYANKRTVYLFCRKDDGTQEIVTDTTFFPYYYEVATDGQYTTYDNRKANKMVVSAPGDLSKHKGFNCYESDVMYPKRYVIDKIDKFDKGPIKYMFLDIEVLAKEMPDPMHAKYTISCITIYNSLYKTVKTWFLKNWKDEMTMLDDFVKYIFIEAPDVLFAWNMEFDYTYLYNRIKDFAKRISPLAQIRYGTKEGVMYPAGISIVDYMLFFKAIKMREQSYALDKVAQTHLGEKPWGKSEFGVLNDDVMAKNINDVKRMIKIEEKYKILDYYDEIRRFSMCFWEDLKANSRILDVMVLKEAKRRNIVLPNKKKYDEESELELQGAYRRANIGVFHDIYKADVASMYPSQMINFCLDAQNITDKETEDTITIDGLIVKQNQDALLPYLAKRLISQKDQIKADIKKTIDPDDKQLLESKYAAIKGLVNSLYGVTAFPSFRLYNFDIASRITFLSRDLLLYTESLMQKFNYEVIYTDTDALMYKAEQDETELLNKFVNDWSIERYNKSDINIQFESEGKFEKILVLGKCHYFGIIVTPSGKVKEEIKGMQIKRSSSSKYESQFQRELVGLIMEGKTKDEVKAWVEQAKKDIKIQPLEDVSFPAKISTKVYKNVPIFVRAVANTQKYIDDYKILKGELFNYIFVKDLGKDENKKPINVVVLDKNLSILPKHLDWDEIIRRNIDMKTKSIFDALVWSDPVEPKEPKKKKEPKPKKEPKEKAQKEGV